MIPDASPSPAAWTPRRILFLGVVGAVLAVSLTAGVRLMNARVAEGDAPARDEKRFADLQVIVARAQEVYAAHKTLPRTLDEIQQKSDGPMSVADPQTFEVYEYNVLGASRFEVCARFEEASAGPAEHRAGRSCFQVQVE
ncbi:MAG: hypothetical protein AB7E79_09470 [Rhodospirillaceae bacterium]